MASKTKSTHMSERLHFLLRGGRWHDVQETLKDLRVPDRQKLVSYKIQGVTALCCAVAYYKPEGTDCKSGDAEFLHFVRYLLDDCNADLNQTSFLKYDMPGLSLRNIDASPLALAIMRADSKDFAKSSKVHMELVQMFLDMGADMFSRESECRTKLMFVNRNGKLCEMLLNYIRSKANFQEMNTTDGFQSTGDKNDVLVVDFINRKDENGHTALHHAQTKEVCDVLLGNGAKSSTLDDNGASPLVTAVIGTHYEMVQQQANGVIEKLMACATTEKEKFDVYELLAANLFTFEAHDLCNFKFLNDDDDEFHVTSSTQEISYEKARYYLRKAFHPEESDGSGKSTSRDRRSLYGELALEDTLKRRFLEGENLNIQQCLILGILIQERILGECHPRTLFSLYLLLCVSSIYLMQASVQGCLTPEQHFDLYKKVNKYCMRQNFHFYLNLENPFMFGEMYDYIIPDWMGAIDNILLDIPQLIEDVTYYFKTHVPWHKPKQRRTLSDFHTQEYFRYLVQWLFSYCQTLLENDKGHDPITDKLRLFRGVLVGHNLEYNFLQTALDKALFQGRNGGVNVAESEGLKLMSLLYSCGFSPNARSPIGETQLSFYSRLRFLHTGGSLERASFCLGLLDLMLKNGLHADLVDEKGKSVIEILQNKIDISEVKECSLKCLASRAIVKYNIDYTGQVPGDLYEFIQYHEVLGKK